MKKHDSLTSITVSLNT
uniref:Uncharacterized protein n=1 Tax=Arundo donax TaxID=35708 RepID=A0A0A8YHY1_ARUDO